LHNVVDLIVGVSGFFHADQDSRSLGVLIRPNDTQLQSTSSASVSGSISAARVHLDFGAQNAKSLAALLNTVSYFLCFRLSSLHPGCGTRQRFNDCVELGVGGVYLWMLQALTSVGFLRAV